MSDRRSPARRDSSSRRSSGLRLEGLGQFLVEALELPSGFSHVAIGNSQLAFESERRLPHLHHPRPLRTEALQRRLRFRHRLVDLREHPRRFALLCFSSRALPLKRLGIGQPAFEASQLALQARSRLPQPVLRQPQLLVTKHAGQELRSLGRREGGHHRQFLLTREIGAEELVAGHAQEALDAGGHVLVPDDRRCVRIVLKQFRRVERADGAEVVRSERELDLDTDRCAGWRGGPSDRVAIPPRRRSPIERPGDGFENRGLPRTVRPDDPRDPGPELDVRRGVLPEIAE